MKMTSIKLAVKYYAHGVYVSLLTTTPLTKAHLNTNMFSRTLHASSDAECILLVHSQANV